MIARVTLLIAAALVALCTTTPLYAARQLQAGAATADITPPLGETVVGGFKPFPATAIHDRLHARCLVLDDGQQRIAIVICDSLGIKREVCDQARAKIAAAKLLPGANVLIAATHTHSATTSSSPKYSPLLVEGIVSAVQQAVKNLEPARIGWGSVNEPREVFNRRWYVKDESLRKNPFGGVDQVRMNPPRGHASLIKPAGPVDPEVSFISVQSKAGRPLALLANYSLHYVGGVNRGDVSADYFGIFAQRITERFDDENQKADADKPFVAMLSNGTSGDVNNINFRERSPRMKPYEKMAEVAGRVAAGVQKAVADIKYHDWVPVAAASQDLTLKVRKPDAAMQKHFASILASDDQTPQFHRYERTYAARVQKLLDGPDDITIMLQALRIGDLAIAAIPFEVFTQIGLDIKQQAPMADAFTIELANGWNGYLPTPEQHKLGGYETWMGTNKVQQDASQHITRTVLQLMKSLKKEPELQRFGLSRPQMGVEFRVVLYAKDEAQATAAARAAYERIEALNKVLSDYDANSELSRLSAMAPMQEPVKVSDDLWNVLSASQKLNEQSGGAFDITVGPLTRLWRRSRRQQKLPAGEKLKQALAATGGAGIKVFPETQQVQLLKPGMQLDAGGIGKGYAAAEALKAMRKVGVTRAFVDASGDMAIGDPPPGKTGWTIGVAPLKPSDPPSELLTLSRCGVATSGDAWQFVEIDGRRYSHIVDPQTGYGLTVRSSVTVVAKDAIAADSLASAVSVLGPQKGIALVNSLPGASTLIVTVEVGKPVTRRSKRFPQTSPLPVER